MAAVPGTWVILIGCANMTGTCWFFGPQRPEPLLWLWLLLVHHHGLQRGQPGKHYLFFFVGTGGSDFFTFYLILPPWPVDLLLSLGSLGRAENV